ncbi:mortality factor 4-like protein 1 [Pelomyxa schiedti]|nr:mortality factor 4-like protein 1 [Pelomyxa schiedti]
MAVDREFLENFDASCPTGMVPVLVCSACEQKRPLRWCQHFGCPRHFHTFNMWEKHVLSRHPCVLCQFCNLLHEHPDTNSHTTATTSSVPAHSETTTTQLSVPQKLKKRLNDEYEMIEVEKHLVPLPRTPTVHDLLIVFLGTCTDEAESLHTLRAVEAIEQCFDVALGIFLLYKWERRQFHHYYITIQGSSASNSDQPPTKSEKSAPPLPSSVYGIEHLTRLLVVMPDVMKDLPLTPLDRNILIRTTNELLLFIVANQWLFVSQYTTAVNFHRSLLNGHP